MGLLDDLGRGLQAAGGIYSPDVYAQQAQERQRQEALAAQQRQATLGILAKAAESGAITPADFQAGAAKLGVQLPPMGEGLATQEARMDLATKQRAAATAARAQDFIEANPEMTPTALARLAIIDPTRAKAIHEAMKANQTKFGHTPTVVMVDGKPRNALIGDDGTTKLLDEAPAVKMEHVDAGGAVVPFDPYRPAVIPKSPTPDALVTDERARNPAPHYDATRGIVVDPRGATATPVMQDGQPIGQKPREIPAAINTAITENANSLRKLDQALEAVSKNPDAFGLKNRLGDEVVQRVDPGGVEARARVADIGSLKLHDRSGAAVTATEFPRLKPFIPAATDSPETVKKKLDLFRQEVQAINSDMSSTYSRAQGYIPSPVLAPPAPVATPSSGAKVFSSAQIDAAAAKSGKSRDEIIGLVRAKGGQVR